MSDSSNLNSKSKTQRGAPHGLVAIHIAVFLFGLSGLLGKMLTTSPLIIVFSRTTLAALVLSLILWLQKSSSAPKPYNGLFFGISGAVLAVHWLTFFQAIQVSTVAIGLLSFSSFPLFVTLMEPLVFRERLRLFDLCTCIMVMAGLVLVVPNFDFSQHLTQGAAWGVLSGLTFAILSILNRKFVRDLSPITMGAGQNAVAAILLLPFACTAPWQVTRHDAALLLLLGLLCTACAHVLFIRGLATVRAQVASVLAALEPVYGILLAWLFLGERASFRTMLGGVLILGATILGSYFSSSTVSNPSIPPVPPASPEHRDGQSRES
jgi:drug/metabolite transporter (DMT)-like permease